MSLRGDEDRRAGVPRDLRGIDEQRARQMSISGRADEHQRARRSAWQPRTGAGSMLPGSAEQPRKPSTLSPPLRCPPKLPGWKESEVTKCRVTTVTRSQKQLLLVDFLTPVCCSLAVCSSPRLSEFEHQPREEQNEASNKHLHISLSAFHV